MSPPPASAGCRLGEAARVLALDRRQEQVLLAGEVGVRRRPSRTRRRSRRRRARWPGSRPGANSSLAASSSRRRVRSWLSSRDSGRVVTPSIVVSAAGCACRLRAARNSWSDVRVHSVDDVFLALPRRALADAALEAATALGAEHADFRLERIRTERLSWRDDALENAGEGTTLGFAVRVVHDGTYGFAAGTTLTVDEAVRVAREAVAVAQVAHPLNAEPIVLAAEPVHAAATWVSAYEVDPFTVPRAAKLEVLGGWARRLLASDHVDHVDVGAQFVKEAKYYLDTAGTETTQQRIRTQGEVEATRLDPSGGFEGMRTLAPPVGRGWEHYVGGEGQYDWESDLAELPELVAEKAKASSVEPGSYDLVIDPSNLWLTIHESIGPRDRARPRTGLRGRVRRDLLRDARSARHAAVRQPGHARHRRPHRRARPRDGRLRRRGRRDPAVGHRVRGPARRLPARPADGRRLRGRPRRRPQQRGAPSPTPPVTSPCSGWPTSHCNRPRWRSRPAISSARSSAASTSSVTSRGRSTCSATTSSSPGSGSTRSAAVGSSGCCATSRTRRPRRSSGTAWKRSAARRRTSSVVPSTAARRSRGQIAPVSHGCPSALFRGVNILNTQREGGR